MKILKMNLVGTFNFPGKLFTTRYNLAKKYFIFCPER